jgi:hypothetical protein
VLLQLRLPQGVQCLRVRSSARTSDDPTNP